MKLNWKFLFITYVLSVLAFSFTARANELTWIPSASSQILPKYMRVETGEVALDLEGRAYLVTQHNEVFELVSETVDFSSLQGSFIQVRGFEPRYSVGPVYRVQTFLPLVEDVKAQPAYPVLVVVGYQILE